jgi:hypothetical protein
MTAAALLSDLSTAGVAVHIDDAGLLKASGDQSALDRWLPEIRTHKAEILALLAANDTNPLAYATAEQLADSRRTCRQCRELAINGRCMAAARGELPLTSTRYEPFADRLERCIGFSPMADDVDQRPGRERFPGLYQRLWATARTGR